MNYPRVITLTHPKLIKLEEEKGQLIQEGREVSKQIEDIELEMGKIDIRLQTEESKIDIKDLKAKGDGLVKEMEVLIKGYTDKVKDVEKAIYERMKEKTSPELRLKHESLTKEKEELEIERNKKALKAQKLKDRIIPLARRLMKPLLENDYEDYNDIKLENGVMVGTIFSHLDEFDKRYKEKLKKNI